MNYELLSLPPEIISEIVKNIPKEHNTLRQVNKKMKLIIDNLPLTLHKIFENIISIPNCICKPKRNKIVHFSMPKCMEIVHYKHQTGLLDPDGYHLGMQMKHDRSVYEMTEDELNNFCFQIHKKTFSSMLILSAHSGWYRETFYLLHHKSIQESEKEKLYEELSQISMTQKNKDSIHLVLSLL